MQMAVLVLATLIVEAEKNSKFQREMNDTDISFTSSLWKYAFYSNTYTYFV